jgi:hypothetical protein
MLAVPCVSAGVMEMVLLEYEVCRRSIDRTLNYLPWRQDSSEWGTFGWGIIWPMNVYLQRRPFGKWPRTSLILVERPLQRPQHIQYQSVCSD